MCEKIERDGSGEEWEHLRRRTFARDDGVCQRCQTERETLQAHKIVSRPSHIVDDPIETLVTVCRPCHAVLHPDTDSFDNAHKKAPLFPDSDAPKSVSRMRTRDDHVCQRCRAVKTACDELVAYVGPDTDRPLLLCQPCAGVLYAHGNVAAEAFRANHRFPATQLERLKSQATRSPHPDAPPAVAIEWEPESDQPSTPPSSTDVDETEPATATGDTTNEATDSTGIEVFFETLLCLTPTGFIFWMLVLPFTGGEGFGPIISALVLTVLFARVLMLRGNAIAVAIRCSSAAMLTIFGIIGYHMSKGPVWYAVGIPLVSIVEYVQSNPATMGVIVFSVMGAVIAMTMYTGWKSESPTDWFLIGRMITAILLLTVLLTGFTVGLWRLLEAFIWWVLVLLGISPHIIAAVLSGWLLVTFVYYEASRIDTVDQAEDVTSVSSNKYPMIHESTTKIAAQLNIPKPTIAISDRSIPEAITVGYRSQSITLILSEGTLNALNEEELEAVIAHELAHVANRDAMVMTVASLPLRFATGLQERIESISPLTTIGDDTKQDGTNKLPPRDRGIHLVFWVIIFIPWIGTRALKALFARLPSWFRKKSPHNYIWIPPLIIAILTKYSSRPALSILSRARESAADRTAVRVTGSPAALASALQTLDKRINGTQTTDLRASLSILPLEPYPTCITEYPAKTSRFTDVLLFILAPNYDDTDKEENGSMIAKLLLRTDRLFFATHPPTARRIDALRELIDDQDTNRNDR
ncbi:M48 family metalloprotease [Halocatena salina]|uniref:M48 family metalloprotease n=1 Tax=Halocatena salina TaxID=2934340 RepID=A0A8U0A502_9EURY|nr:M48 family metalloprotease [Halocatena salina]UPM43879.1 M48 family metalloprotease [Halocatena salina]